MRFDSVGFAPADLMLPRADLAPEKWACIACDQYTSEPAYWARVGEIVGGAPSTLRMFLPENELDQLHDRLPAIRRTMQAYLEQGVVTEKVHDGFVLVERSTAHGRRIGLVGTVDLEHYDATPGARALVRPTERTIQSRLPVRVTIRREAALELSHVLLLLDDPEKTVIEPLYEKRECLRPLYDFELMQGGGHLRGWAVDGEADLAGILDALTGICLRQDENPLMLAVGDGNHSLAAAKRIWEEIKAVIPEEQQAGHPARFAMAEAVNIYQDAISFEPIHRLLSDVDSDQMISEWRDYCESRSMELLEPDQGENPDSAGGISHEVVLAGTPDRRFAVTNPDGTMPADTLQRFLEYYMRRHAEVKIDYIHGEDRLRALCAETGTAGFLLPAIRKEEFFTLLDRFSVMPLKTFSIGEADEKRFYMECRRIG